MCTFLVNSSFMQPILNNYCALFSFHCYRYKILATSKDGVRFTSRALEAEALQLQEVCGQYEEVQRDLVEQVGWVYHE